MITLPLMLCSPISCRRRLDDYSADENSYMENARVLIAGGLGLLAKTTPHVG